MALPPPGGGVYWKNYEIATPTFDLTPIEKPDMSPFLFHMTGRNQIEAILQGGGRPGVGHFEARVPQYGDEVGFRGRVVCFTETPTFALDFFRYRKYHRWQTDQRFGLAFRKAELAAMGVRPVAYLDPELVRTINGLKSKIDEPAVLSEDTERNAALTHLISSLYPLVLPHEGAERRGGFMWEREWRYADPAGLDFRHTNIKVVCCPAEEEARIRALVGQAAAGITFIQSWMEYDEVTAYLRGRAQALTALTAARPATEQDEAELDRNILRLEQAAAEHEIFLNSLEAYAETVDGLRRARERLNTAAEIRAARERRDQIAEELRVLREAKQKSR